MINLNEKFRKIWQKCLPYYKQGRSGDRQHAEETVKFILNYQGKLKIDKDVIIPVAMMHDIGHAAILHQHLKYVTGPKKIVNGKLVHMLAGAKIAHDILKSAGYDKKKAERIVEIISMHDYDQLTGANLKKVYNTRNKKIFHDIDSLDRYTEKRISNLSSLYKNRKELMKVLASLASSFFYQEFKDIAQENLKILNK